MKKRVLLCLIGIVLTAVMCAACGVKTASYSAEVFEPTSVNQEALLGDLTEFVYGRRLQKNEITSGLTADAGILNRTAFSVGKDGGADAGERAAALRLKTLLMSYGFQDGDPDKNNPDSSYAEDLPYVKTQSFTETIRQSSGLFNTSTKDVFSQNIVATIPTAAKSSAGQVILAAHYDNIYGSDLITGVQNHGVYSGGLATAAVLRMADMLKAEELPFDVKLVFFGASEVGQFGSNYYISNMSESDKASTLMMMNFDLLGGGDYDYMFVEETATDGEEFLRAAASAEGADILRAPRDRRVVRIENANQSYLHYGLIGDHYAFYKAGINTASFFGLNWNYSSDQYGIYESSTKNSILATSDDTLYQVATLYPEYLTRTAKVAETVIASVKNQKFASVMELTNDQHGTASFWARNDIALYVFAGLVGVLEIILILTVTAMKKRKPKPEDIVTPPSTCADDVFADYNGKQENNDNDNNGNSPPPSDSPFEGY